MVTVSREAKAKRLYRVSRQNAKRRGIAFRFAADEWIAWWERHIGPNWMQLRGPGRAQYQMARRGDLGAYEPRNVRCVTGSENMAEYWNVPGRRSPRRRAPPPTTARERGHRRKIAVAKMVSATKELWRLRRLTGRWDVSALYREQKARRAKENLRRGR